MTNHSKVINHNMLIVIIFILIYINFYEYFYCRKNNSILSHEFKDTYFFILNAI